MCANKDYNKETNPIDIYNNRFTNVIFTLKNRFFLVTKISTTLSKEIHQNGFFFHLLAFTLDTNRLDLGCNRLNNIDIK